MLNICTQQKAGVDLVQSHETVILSDKLMQEVDGWARCFTNIYISICLYHYFLNGNCTFAFEAYL